MSEKILLIDGHSILNRAFYGLPDLTNAKGQHTNAVLGFLNIMFRILDEDKPQYMAVAFDRHEPTFRHLMFDGYKGTRKPMPEELRSQIPMIKDMLKAMGVVTLEHAGWEADDILGSLAKQSEAKGMEVVLLSGDRDLLQIASQKIKIRIPKTKPGKTEIEDYFEEDVLAKYQVTPAQFIELKALMGDTADNIPGVPKVGEKTATELMTTYGSIEEIYAHIDDITKKSIRESLRENRELADLSLKLATIKIDCELGFDYEAAKAEGFYTPEAYELCKEYEFKSFLGRFDKEAKESAAAAQGGPDTESFEMIRDYDEQAKYWKTLLSEATDAHKKGAPLTIGLFLLYEGRAAGQHVGVAVSVCDGKTVFLPAFEDWNRLQSNENLCKLSTVAQISVCDCKRVYAVLDEAGRENCFDTLIAAYLLNPLKNDYDATAIANEHLGIMIPSKSEVFGKKSASQVWAEQESAVVSYACLCAYTAAAVKKVLERKLTDTGMMTLFKEVEMPLSYVLYDMEEQGIIALPDELKEYGDRLTVRIDELEKSIYEQAGEEFNINSPKQLGEILFEKLQIPGGKKTKTGYSTAADVLEKLAEEYPVVNDILEYRGLTKLKSTYADGLASCIEGDGRIHTTFNQTITATGRISSTEPNLQNIPMRMELGRQIRKVFVPREGYLFTDADYSQIELRVLAHMSGDEELIDSYRSGKDIHRITASKVFGVPFEEVTDLQRRNAKAVNFGIVYGISSFGLSQGLSISKEQAKQYIEQYFATYPGLKTYIDNLVKDAKETGYAVTLFGRKRPVPELKSAAFMQRAFGERIAMNSPVQGTAADIIKIAMIRTHKALKEAGLKSRLILQVHDELVVETANDEKEQVAEIIREAMMGAADLKVKLEIDMHTGSNWYEAK